MEPIIAFLIEHWMLSSAFVVILVLFGANELRQLMTGMKQASCQQLVALLNHSKAIVIDIRPAERFDEGHILGAINLPQADFSKRLNTLTKYKGKPVVLVCASGISAPKMGGYLKSEGFTELYCLEGGMAAWQSQGMPVDTASST